MLGKVKNSFLRTSSWIWVQGARRRGVQVAAGVRFNGRPVLRPCKGSSISIGEGSILNSYRTSNPLLCAHPVSMRTTCANAKIVVGRGVGISSAVLSAAASIEIGAGTLVGAGAMIIDNDFHEWSEADARWGRIGEGNARPVVIGENAFIGARAIILKGVSIGTRATIGAGAVVTRDVPDFAIVAGNPAKVIG